MGKCIQGGCCYADGGIFSLAEFVNEHYEAIESDLLRETGHELSDVGGSLSWDALGSFIKHITPSSATAREMDPDTSLWSMTVKTNSILADIYDILATINANLVAIGSGKRPKQPHRYPRPGDKDKNRKQFGEGALPPDELQKWFEERMGNNG